MKIIKNPFFYLSLILVLILVFQIATIVRGAAGVWVGPTQPYPNGNPGMPFYQSAAIQQDPTSGALVAPVSPGASAGPNVSIGSGLITFGADTSLQVMNNSGTRTLALTPLTGSNYTNLYFGSAGLNINQMNVNNPTALLISPGGTPSTNLGTNFNLDFNGSVNGKSLCLSGDCKTAWSQVGGSSQQTGQWNLIGSDLRYSAGNVIVDKALVDNQGSFPDGATSGSIVCIDDRAGLIYELSGTVARVYISGTDAGGTLWGNNCNGDPGEGKTSIGKVLFLSWDWSKTNDPSVNVAVSEVGSSVDRVETTYTPSTPDNTRLAGNRWLTSPGSDNVNMYLYARWSKSAAPSYQQSYTATVGTFTPEQITLKNVLQLTDQKIAIKPACPGPNNANVGLLWRQDTAIYVCSTYTDTSGNTLLGWHSF